MIKYAFHQFSKRWLASLALLAVVFALFSEGIEPKAQLSHAKPTLSAPVDEIVCQRDTRHTLGIPCPPEGVPTPS